MSQSRSPIRCLGSLQATSAQISSSKIMKTNSLLFPRARSKGNSTCSTFPYFEKYFRISSSLMLASIPPTKTFLQIGLDFARFGSICLSLIVCGISFKTFERRIVHQFTSDVLHTASRVFSLAKVMKPNPRGLPVTASNLTLTFSTSPYFEKYSLKSPDS